MASGSRTAGVIAGSEGDNADCNHELNCKSGSGFRWSGKSLGE